MDELGGIEPGSLPTIKNVSIKNKIIMTANGVLFLGGYFKIGELIEILQSYQEQNYTKVYLHDDVEE